MATSQLYLIEDNTTDANFRSWGSAVSAAILAMGWAATSDTGQVNWTTVTSPASGVFVYEIWKPTDALQTGASQFFLKVEYGSSSAGTKGARFRMSIGTATNGSGTLTGFVSTVFEPGISNAGGQGTALVFETDISGDTDRLGIILWRTLGGHNPMFAIERTKNTDGTNNAEGVTIVATQNTSGVVNGGQQTIMFGVGVAPLPASRSYMAMSLGQNASGGFNNNIPICPIFPYYGKFGNPMTAIAMAQAADIAAGALVTTTLYGASRTYLSHATGPSVVQPANAIFLLRWD